jgi:hypothetical protein
MRFLSYILLLQISSVLSFGQSVQSHTPNDLPNKPGALVRSLYTQVVTRAPDGLLDSEENTKIFTPYLSRSLRYKIQMTRACSKDYFRQNGYESKAPFAWSEFGPFSGSNERTSPGSFQIGRIKREKDGSFQVGVRFTYRPTDGPGSWRVKAIVIRENGDLFLGDIIFPKEDQEDSVRKLSAILSEGCSGSRWVGYHDLK